MLAGWRLWATVSVIATAPLNVGVVLGYTSPCADSLVSEALLTHDQLYVFEALSPLGAVAGALASGSVSDALGRRVALALVVCLPLLVGWACIAGAATASPLFVGRAATGFGQGMSALRQSETASVCA